MKKRIILSITIPVVLAVVLVFIKEKSVPSVTEAGFQTFEKSREQSVQPPMALVESFQGLETPEEQTEPTPLTSMKGAESLPQTEQQSLWTAFSEARRKIRPLTEHQKKMPGNEGALYLASSPSQKIRARFLEGGVRLLSGYPGREWEGVLSLASDDEVLDVRQDGTQIEYVRDGIVEWFHNKPEGLEHGYIVDRKTNRLRSEATASQADGQLMVPVQISGLEVQEFEEGGLQFVNEAGEPVLSYSKLKVWDANGVELASVMEPTDSGLNILVADAGAAYPITIDPLITSMEEKLTASDAATDDGFGVSVSLDENTALIGAAGDADAGLRTGSTYVFVRSGSSWSEQAKLTASDAAANDRFGVSVSVDGDTALVGADGGNDAGTGTGSAYVFVRSGVNWSEQAKLLASDAAANNSFGASVSISGDTVLVGAAENDSAGSNAGSAYVFVRSGTNWSEQAKLSIPGLGSYFGSSVSLDGDAALIGARLGDGLVGSSGSAYVFVRSGTNWSKQATLYASDGISYDRFGSSVSLDGDTALIGAYGDDDGGSSSGSAYFYARTGTNWSEQAKVTASDAMGGDWFGRAVSMNGDTAVVGAYRNSDAGSESGSAYMFVRSGTNWNELTKLTAFDAAAGDRFGSSVSVDGDTVLIGAYNDEDDAGSAYVYRLLGPTEIGVSVDTLSLSDGDGVPFGNYAIGNDKILLFTIANEGGVNLTDLAVTKSGADTSVFGIGALGATNLAYAQQTTFRVTFTPMSANAHTATIHIASNDADENPFDITLTGTGLPNSDTDPGSDAWETANGFSPTVSGDVMTLDSDGDGSLDIMEIYQGTERYPVVPESSFAVMALGEEEAGNGFTDVYADSNGVLKVQYRRSTAQTAVVAQGIWVPALTNSWLYSGESSDGAVVAITDNVISNGVDFEIVESSAEVTDGNTDALFFTLELSPSE